MWWAIWMEWDHESHRVDVPWFELPVAEQLGNRRTLGPDFEHGNR